jgi:hypothetical protein
MSWEMPSEIQKSTRQELPTAFLIEQEKRAGEVIPSPVPMQERD